MNQNELLAHYDVNKKTLNLSYIKTLTIIDFEEIRKFLDQHKEIETLDLSDKDLPLPLDGLNMLNQITSIKCLKLNRCKLNDGAAQIIAEHPSLTNLEISSNKIGDIGGTALARNIHLVQLDISKNLLKNDSIINFAKNTTLEILNVSMNKFNSLAAKALAANRTLRIIYSIINPSNKDNLAFLKSNKDSHVFLNEGSPHKRANWGRTLGIENEVPSLKRLCLFYVSKNPTLQNILKNTNNILPQELKDALLNRRP